jgi:hypothetical protein
MEYEDFEWGKGIRVESRGLPDAETKLYSVLEGIFYDAVERYDNTSHEMIASNPAHFLEELKLIVDDLRIEIRTRGWDMPLHIEDARSYLESQHFDTEAIEYIVGENDEYISQFY